MFFVLEKSKIHYFFIKKELETTNKATGSWRTYKQMLELYDAADLIQMTQMKSVFSDVDPTMVNIPIEWPKNLRYWSENAK